MRRHNPGLRVLELPRPGWFPKISNVQVMTHSGCSADCVFCPWVESEHNTKNRGRMADETWNLILANLAPWSETLNTGKFCPYLMNEPLIDKSIFAKIDDVYRCFPQTCVEVSTNGAALTENVSDQLLSRFTGRRHDIWVSHHGIDEATFTHIMAQDYNRATRNLLALLRASDGRFTIKIRGAGESHDGQHKFFTRQQYLDYWERLFAEHSINRQNVSVDAFHFHDRAGTLHRADRGANTMNMGTVRKIDPQHPFHCWRIDEWLHFKWDGSIVICCMDYHSEVKLPSIKDTSLLDYFYGQEYHDLVEQVSGRKACSPDFICARCTSPGG
jgi:hypothetical protein